MLYYFTPFVLACSTLLTVSSVESKREVSICKQTGSYQILNTVPITQTNQTSLTFSVKTCKHARIILTDNTTSFRPAYIIIIGLWTKHQIVSRITTCFSEKFTRCLYSSIETPSILSCSEFRTFWVSWNTNITFGQGDIIGDNITRSEMLYNEVVIDFIGIQTVSGDNDKWTFNSEINDTIGINAAIVCEGEDETTTLPDIPPNCTCSCIPSGNHWEYLNDLNLTTEQLYLHLKDRLSDLKASISINLKSTRIAKSKLRCADDNRSVSRFAGVIGSLVLVAVASFIVYLDLVGLVIKS
ncbi:Hypothetical predicted protein [Mytilus galloprovincialis]|uniref:Farnesoic acid O-methyl transferase domain-containing protein n=1 Tax=Mytilus galloprovincialis TaxID=29158 RepID=A0A8B6CPU6_MYTGA|nr:Hypothetical predicted protein [Mytilus galloprovincialis]